MAVRNRLNGKIGTVEPVETPAGRAVRERAELRQSFVDRFAELCKELEASGFRVFTQYLVVDGKPGVVQVGITEK